jgi:hypothetical protein
MSDLFTFDVAISRLDQNPDNVSFAFFPELRAGNIAGGKVFSLSKNDDDDYEEGDTLYWFNADGGLFFSSFGEEDYLSIDDFDDDSVVQSYGIDPRKLLYKACTKEQALSASGMQTEYAVAILNGRDDLVPDSIQDASPTWLGFLTQHLVK